MEMTWWHCFYFALLHIHVLISCTVFYALSGFLLTVLSNTHWHIVYSMSIQAVLYRSSSDAHCQLKLHCLHQSVVKYFLNHQALWFYLCRLLLLHCFCVHWFVITSDNNIFSLILGALVLRTVSNAGEASTSRILLSHQKFSSGLQQSQSFSGMFFWYI